MKCTMLHKGLMLHATGHISPCCRYEYNWERDGSDTIDKLPTTMEEYWEFKDYADDRKIMEEGGIPRGCASCLSNFGVFDSGNNEDLETYGRIQIEFTNNCNLACRYCTPRHSTVIGSIIKNKLDTDVYFDDGSKTDVTEYGLLNIDLDIFENEVPNIDPVDVQIMISGGEPFKDPKRLLRILEMLPKHADVYIATNGMYYNEDVLDVLTTFKSGTYLMSIDGVPEVDDYIRVFSNGDKKMEYFKKIHEKYPSLRMNFNLTTTNVSIQRYGEFMGYLLKHVGRYVLNDITDFPNQFYINASLVSWPEPLALQSMSITMRNNTITQLIKDRDYYIKKLESRKIRYSGFGISMVDSFNYYIDYLSKITVDLESKYGTMITINKTIDNTLKLRKAP